MSVVLVPHGTGIGDFVNLRPLAAAVIAHHVGKRVQVLGPAHQAWLLPDGASIKPPSPWTRMWSRMSHDHVLATWLAGLHVGTIRQGMPPKVLAVLARGLTQQLERQGFEVVNLLEGILSLDLDQRWTSGPWTSDNAHIIDLLAVWLGRRGIFVPNATRKPRLQLPADCLDAHPLVILSPNAGSTLKEPSLHLWIDLATQLLVLGIRPFVVAAPGRNTALQIQSLVPEIGTLSSPNLRQVAGWLAGADVVVSPDSGILHLASALDRPTVGLFGATDSAFLGPYGAHSDSFVISDFSHETICRGCWAAQMLPKARCPLYERNCLQGVSASAVLRTVLIRLGITESPGGLPLGVSPDAGR